MGDLEFALALEGDEADAEVGPTWERDRVLDFTDRIGLFLTEIERQVFAPLFSRGPSKHKGRYHRLERRNPSRTRERLSREGVTHHDLFRFLEPELERLLERLDDHAHALRRQSEAARASVSQSVCLPAVK